MIDISKLREALNSPIENLLALGPIVDAARILAEGERVWWCLAHNKEMATMSYCWGVLLASNLNANEFCGRVRKILVDDSEGGEW